MKVSILGGGSEIGASCLHVHIGETDLLIDAGMRVHGDDLLPAFGMLDNLGEPEAVLVTHAHADHIGALPIVHRLYPKAPIFATPPTADLMQIMMRDSFKIMEQRCLETRSLIPYTKEQMEETLRAVRLFPAGGTITFGDAKVTLYRAGHILGAVMFLIEGGSEKLLVSGDLSFKAGRTIPGAEVPAGTRPDALILESTYGNREHSDRNTEEKRLADNVAEVIAVGGFALIPAFALGRAQEVLLILQDYMDRGLIPEFPIYVDGLVTPISKIYRRYPQFLKGPVAHRIRTNGDAFLTEGRCTAVQPKEREAVLQGKPACIIASSGMLIGGASVWYAERLIGGAQNAIFITGYQDEESPGRKLLNLAEGESDELELNGTVHSVKCRVGKYGLSAHGDAGELNRFIDTVRPAHTLLVHGDDEARAALNERIEKRYRSILSENGEAYTFRRSASGREIRSGGPQRGPDRALKEKVGCLILYRKKEDEPFHLALCTGVHGRTHSLICQTPKGKQIRLSPDQTAETIGRWNRSFDELQSDSGEVFAFARPFIKKIDWERAKEGHRTFAEMVSMCLPEASLKQRLAAALVLQALPDRFRTLNQGTARYRIDRESRRLLASLALPVQGLKMNVTLAMDKIRERLADQPHFIRCGADGLGTADERITLYFDFPDTVGLEERKKLSGKIKDATGWTAAFSDSVRTDLLQAKIGESLGTSVSPSIYLDTKCVSLPIKCPENGGEIAEKIKKETGFTLQFKDEPPAPADAEERRGVPPEFFRTQTPSPRLENNEAIHEAKVWAADRGITIYKASMKQRNGLAYMEVHFITPEVAMRHTADMEELSCRTGLPITFAKNPKQNEIIRTASELIPEDWGLQKNPSLHPGEALLTVKLPEKPPEEEVRRVGERIEERTGYRLSVLVR
ncbi:MBL fold metallo-hydrolase [Sporolactobacillus sp. KGMB 08714]|uniref:MBL fold metallo-hydrolase n=1 Tax=Sporolactobacillus sp. KGMB 08714 TaxID=3064704 RepID=UPI002FBD9FAB